MDAPGSSTDDRFLRKHGAEPPRRPPLSNVCDTVMPDVTTAKHVGEGAVGGVNASTSASPGDVDWQLWVEKVQARPRKLVVTSKAVTGAPGTRC